MWWVWACAWCQQFTSAYCIFHYDRSYNICRNSMLLYIILCASFPGHCRREYQCGQRFLCVSVRKCACAKCVRTGSTTPHLQQTFRIPAHNMPTTKNAARILGIKYAPSIKIASATRNFDISLWNRYIFNIPVSIFVWDIHTNLHIIGSNDEFLKLHANCMWAIIV